MDRWAFLLPLAAALAVLGLAGCGSSGSSNRSTLTLPLYGGEAHDRGILDPALETPATPLAYASLTQAGLVKLGPDLHALPDLAVSLPTISVPRARSYTFTLRQDARFADGTACTATDVAYSLARALRFGSPLARQYLGDIIGAPAVERGQTWHLPGVTALSRLTVRIRLRQPDDTFLTKLAFPVASIVEPSRAPGIPNGLGPFAFAAPGRDGTLTARPRRHYFGSVQLRQVRLIPAGTLAHGLDLFHSGTVDAAQVPFGSFASASTRSDFFSSPSLDAYYALPERSNPTLAGVNQAEIATAVGPAVDPMSGLVPSAVPDYQSGAAGTSSPPTDPTTQTRLVLSDPSDAGLQAIRRALARQWTPTHSGPRALLVHVWRLLPDPTPWLALSPDLRRSSWYRSVMRQELRMTFDQVGRMGLLQTSEAWTIGRGAIVPLASGRLGYLEKSRVDNLEVTPEGLMPENADWTTVSLNPGP